ncbi:MAG: putative dehydrogenase [Rhodobacteraceae bacterium HLUCCA08]|nr:MAG: putative dehydrogenase [Rhodobacteraceae bacterium HLUCCA08]
MADKVKVGIVGLGRWARVLTRGSKQSDQIEIVKGYSRSEEKRNAFAADTGMATVDSMDALLSDPEIQGVILTVPNEQHLPVAEAVAKAGKHIYTEKPIANTLENGIRLEALQEKYGVRAMVGHSARLLRGARMMKDAIDSGELGTLSFMESNFSNERALELTPDTWRWYRDKAPGGPLSQLATHLFDSLYMLGGEIDTVASFASKLSPVGAEVDDQSMTVLRFSSGALGYVGSSWTTAGVYFIRVYGQNGLMHFELDFGSWDDPDKVHETSTLYIQRGKDGYGKREVLDMGASNMFTDELDMFAQMCRTGNAVELEAANGIVALGVVNAALASIERNGEAVKLTEIIDGARSRAAAEDQSAA